MRPLLIPYAIDIDRDVKISADEIAELMLDPRSTLRLQATAYADVGSRKMLPFICPACAQRVYPRAPTRSDGRHYWSHLPRGAYECTLERKRKLTPDQINARIFHGRQEGEAHKELVALLAALATRDPSIDMIEIGAYEAPTAAMRDEFPFGRFPDVKFTCSGNKVVLEAQLATITLHGINGRRAFYERAGTSLLWVMRNFDPRGQMKASVRDIVADQSGLLFSLDSDLTALSEDDGIFRLRAWAFQGDDPEEPWESSIVTIADAVARARPMRWSDDFKRRWIEEYRGASYWARGKRDPYVMLNEVAAQVALPPFEFNQANNCLLSLVRLMISLEAGFVAGAGHPQLISIANGFGTNGGHRAISLIRKAIERWQPQLLDRASMQGAFTRARKELEDGGVPEWGRLSAIGRMRDALFPDWELDESGRR